MLWLASFPRSGNTFFRNVLYEVYGIESSTFHRDPQRELDENYADYRVVKTHLLPSELPPDTQDWPAVYLVRDGRDSLVSIAHHRKDIVEPGTDFYNNLLEAILAQGGSYFGGWSENVRQWANRAAVVIRFEDLIEDPIREVEKLRSVIDLPQPDINKLPTFKQLKFGRPQYGAGKKAKGNQDKHFRRGKAGGWKDELPADLEKLLLNIHGRELQRWGYLTEDFATSLVTPKKVMIECSKLYGHDNDGVKRYLSELVFGLSIVLPHLPEWDVCLYDRKSIQPIIQPIKEDADVELEEGADFKQVSEKEVILKDRRTMGYEKQLLLLKTRVKKIMPTPVYRALANFYLRGPFRTMLNNFKLFARRWKFRKNEAEVFSEVAAADLIHLPLPQHFTELPEHIPPLVVTAHDLTHKLLPDFHTVQNIELSERGMQKCLERDAHFIAVSQSTSNDLSELYDIPVQRISKVLEAVNVGKFRPSKLTASIRKRYKVPDEPYLMCLSTIEPRKNLQNTIRAFLAAKVAMPNLKAKLLICGKSGWKTDTVFEGVNLNHPDLVFTGFVEDIHLPALYSGAAALCYLSFYEGFGLPMLEAMACRTPVIYANNSSLPEVAGEGGIVAKADDVEDIKTAMISLLTDQELQANLARAAKRQANTFSWLKTALRTLAVYDAIITQKANA